MTLRRIALLAALAWTMAFAVATTASACDGRYEAWCGKQHSTTYNQKAIRRVADLRGYGSANTDRLLYIAKRESTYRNWVTNGPCKGMFQLDTNQPKSKWANPYWNTNRAITYIKDRYGTPAAAIQHIRAYGWY